MSVAVLLSLVSIYQFSAVAAEPCSGFCRSQWLFPLWRPCPLGRPAELGPGCAQLAVLGLCGFLRSVAAIRARREVSAHSKRNHDRTWLPASAGRRTSERTEIGKRRAMSLA